MSEIIAQYSTLITAFVAGWCLFFLSHPFSKLFFPSYSKLSANDKVEWLSRVVSNIHAVIVTYGALKVLGTKVFNEAPFTAWTEEGGFYIQILLGYFAYDFLLVLGNKQLRTPGMIIHHGMGLFAYSIVLVTQQLQYLALLWMATELTTPFVNQRWFLHVAKKSNTLLYNLNGVLMTLIFLLWRVIYIPYLAISAYLYHSDDLELVPAQIRPLIVTSLPAITLLNSYWTYLMVRGIIKHLFKPKTTTTTTTTDKKIHARKQRAD